MIFNFAMTKDYVTKNPVDKQVKTAKQRKKRNIEVLTVSQYDEMIDKCDDLGLLTILYTGLRISELLALEPKHIQNCAIQIEQSLDGLHNPRKVGAPKSDHAYRTIPIPKKLMDKIAVRLSEMGTERFVYPLGYSACQTKLNKLCKAVGVPRMMLHTLRHSHCTYLLAKGVTPIVVSKRLGHHATGFTLDTYGHLIPEMNDKLMEVLG